LDKHNELAAFATLLTVVKSSKSRKGSVLIILGGFAGGGSERTGCWLASSLHEAGFDVHVTSFVEGSRHDFPLRPGIHIHRRVFRSTKVRSGRYSIAAMGRGKLQIGSMLLRLTSPLRSAGRWWHIRKVANAVKPETVLSFGDQLSVETGLALLENLSILIVAERSDPRFKPTSILVKALRGPLYRRVPAVVFQTQPVREEMARRWTLSNSHVIPNAIVDRASRPLKPLRNRRKDIVMVGRLVPVKNHLAVIRSWSISKARNLGWRLLIIGDGPLRDQISNQIAEVRCEDSVVLLGHQSRPKVWLSNARIFLLPSLWEGFPNALLDAMDTGCACLTSIEGGWGKAILGSNYPESLVPARDEKAWAQAIDRIVTDLTLADALGAQASARATLFDQEEILDTWIRLIRTIERSKVDSDEREG